VARDSIACADDPAHQNSNDFSQVDSIGRCRQPGHGLLKARIFATVAAALLSICSRQNQPVDAIRHFHLMEIDQQTHWHVKKLHVAQELRLVNG
jgi:hypothetical protein